MTKTPAPLTLSLGLSLLAAATGLAQSPPATDIFLASLDAGAASSRWGTMPGAGLASWPSFR